MSKIVAIGGGEISELETLAIDKEIVKLTAKDSPQALFIPTASNDAEGYWETFQAVYGERLGCRTDVLYLIKEDLAEKEIKTKILGADLIYVGGGNTKKMLKIWRKLNVDQYLETALEQGIVLSGLSAGSICWFKYGHSDSLSFSEQEEWNYIKVEGLGFIDAFHCPHYDQSDRAEDFSKMLAESNELGIAIEDRCAIEFVDGSYRIISAGEEANAYKIYQKEGELISEVIEKIDD